ncbi:hypothetical protein LDENG_00257720 [Lucifuga dentata]|nr:hypothetical protein LDENG_00257720 [Lucifuga dentata]
MDEDFLLALQLQEQFDNEYETSLFSSNGFEDNIFEQSNKKRKVEVTGSGSDVVPSWKPTVQPERPMSIVDESWEMLDPNPDVRAMFLEFNDMFFWGKLSGVEVKWSPRMTLSAGVCSYEGRGGLCSIRLSEPLLKLRPRKDLVETLLHEMIHALLFVTQNNRDRDGHGPEFCKHMNRINKSSGTKITVFHSFHNEVDVYRQHWWRCNGPCQNRRPYFGYVKRAMNRAPSVLDPWWVDHQRTCGGIYTKIKEPEGYRKKGKTGGSKDKVSEKKTSGSGKPSSTTTGSGSQDIRNVIPFTGKGFLLGGKSQSYMSSPPPRTPEVPAVTTSSSSPASSPKKLFPPSPPANLTSPAHPVPAGQKPPKKWSVGNTRVFINIDGSPVKIPKPCGSNGSRGKACRDGGENQKIKQRSIEDLLNRTGIKTNETKREVAPSAPESPMSASSSYSSSLFSEQQESTSFPSTPKSGPSKAKYPSVVPTETKASPANPEGSKHLKDSGGEGVWGAAGGSPAARKRPWENSRSSASISDFFQKTSGSESGASRDSMKTKSPALQQKTAATSSSSSSSLCSSGAPHSVSSSSSSSSFVLTVSCPVCEAKVQESEINTHLDSCLS